MYNTYIFEITRESVPFFIGRWNLTRFFTLKNPFWAKEGEPLDVSDRQHALDCLKNELPQGYSMDPVDERIDIINPDIYLQESINRLQTIKPSLPLNYPLGWWKKEVCLFCGILIYFDEELFTLHEFLLYMVSMSKDKNIKYLYVRGIFEYVC